MLGCEVLVAGDGVEALEQAAMDGGGGFAVELLVDDGLDESLEGRLRAGDAHGEGAGALDELAEFGVGGGELLACESEVVARRARARERTRHEMTVTQRREKVFWMRV